MFYANSGRVGPGKGGPARCLLTRLVSLVVAVAIGISPLGAGAARANEGTSNPKYAAIVVEADTGRVLFASRADSERYPASLTKMMTLYLLFSALKSGKVALTDKFTVSTYATQQAPSKLGVGAGTKIRVEDALESLVIQSANDIAVVVAENLGGSEKNFAKMMTDQARALGMNRTTYRNASGLPNPGQITTARDLYVLADRLMTDFPEYYHYFRRTTFSYGPRTYKTHNHLVGKVEGVDGIKTGYTRASGFNLVTSASRNGHRLIAVVMGGRSVKSRDDHMKALIAQQFAALDRKYSNAVAGFTPAPRGKPEGIADTALMPGPRPKPGSGIAAVDVASQTGTPSDRAPETKIASRFEVPVLAPAAYSSDPGPAASVPADGSLVVSAPRPNPLRPLESEGQGDISESADQDTPDVADPEAKWGIQIGAYVSQDTATSRLQAARTAMPEVLASRPQLILRVDIDGTTFYRARFGPFTKKQADETCAALAPRGFRCFAVVQEAGAEFRTAGSPGAPASP